MTQALGMTDMPGECGLILPVGGFWGNGKVTTIKAVLQAIEAAMGHDSVVDTSLNPPAQVEHQLVFLVPHPFGIHGNAPAFMHCLPGHKLCSLRDGRVTYTVLINSDRDFVEDELLVKAIVQELISVFIEDDGAVAARLHRFAEVAASHGINTLQIGALDPRKMLPGFPGVSDEQLKDLLQALEFSTGVRDIIRYAPTRAKLVLVLSQWIRTGSALAQ